MGLNGYSIFRTDRNHGTDPHGGVLIAVKPNLNPSLVTHESSQEVTIVNLSLGNQNMKIVAVYRSTAMNREENEAFVNFLSSKIENENKLILFGDLNYPGINWSTFAVENPSERLFVDLVNENYLHQCVEAPTRGNNILDLILSTDDDLISDVFIGDCFSTSDHSYITCIIQVLQQEDTEELVYRPNFREADWETIRIFLANVNWTEVFENKDLDGMCDVMNCIIQTTVSNFVPLKQISLRNILKWENREIKRLIAEKNKKWSTFRRNSTRRNKTAYNRYPNLSENELTKLKATMNILYLTEGTNLEIFSFRTSIKEQVRKTQRIFQIYA